MKTKTLIVLACLAVVLFVQESYGIKCYDCTGCSDPFDKNGKGVTTPDCPSGSCMKTKGKAMGQSVIVRNCAPAKMSDKCESASAAGGSATVCGCNTDLCNAAATSTLSVTAMLSLVAGIFMYKNIL